MTWRTPIAAALLAALLLTTACSDDGSDTTSPVTTPDSRPTDTTDNEPAGDCPEADTTVAMEDCLGAQFAQLDAERQALAASVADGAVQPESAAPDEPTAAERWTAAEVAFVAYRDQTCDAVHFEYLDGTIRGIEELSCRIDLTRDHISFLHEAGTPEG